MQNYIFYGCRYPNTETDEQYLCLYGLPLIPTDFTYHLLMLSSINILNMSENE